MKEEKNNTRNSSVQYTGSHIKSKNHSSECIKFADSFRNASIGVKEQQVIIDGLSREYHTIWLMKGKEKHELLLFRSTGVKTIRNAVELFLKEPDYESGVKQYIEKYVHEEDKQRVSEAVKFDVIEKETPETGTYVVSYRRYNADRTDYDYHQMCFARAAGDDGEINYIFAFRDADKSLREQLEKNERIAQQSTFTNFFLDTYVSAYYVDLEKLSCQIYKRTAELENNYPIITDYFASLKEYINKDVHPEDREKLLEIVKPNIMKKILTQQYEYTHVFRDISDGKEKTYKLQVIRGADTNHAAFGFLDISAEMTEHNRKLKVAEEERKKFLDTLTNDFDEVFQINLLDDSIIILKFSEESDYRNFNFKKYTEARDYYISNKVYNLEKDHMKYEMDINTIRQKIRKYSNYSVEFRNCINGVLSWNEMVVNFLDENDVAIGFVEKSEEILYRHMYEKMNEDIFALFVLDVDEEIMRVEKAAPWYKTYKRGMIIPYDTALNDFISGLEGTTKEFFLPLLDINYVKKEFASENKQSFSYKTNNVYGEKWVTTTGYVIHRHKDGTPAILTIGFSLMDTLGADREELQSKLRVALDMAQSANRAKTTFLNNMSHDIRTPMNAIIGFTCLAASHIDNRELVKDYLNKITQSSSHLLSLINDVLDMSRIESGKMNLDEKPEDISEMIHTLRDIVQADIHSKQIDFYVDVVDVIDEEIICDKLRMNQVLLNILSNAIKYTPSGGMVSMRIKETSVRNSGYGTYEFIIKDNGMGMDKEFLDTIYDPFTRVKSSTVSGIQGTGLGMAIAKNIVGMMGGDIQIKSEPGKGTEVKLTIDFKLQNKTKEPVIIPELSGIRGLVIDDDINSCMSVANMLRDIGMRDEWCTSGKEAVLRAAEAARRGDSFRVFIIDWLMPEMNGIETARRIRKAIGNEAPIIVLTAYDWSDIEEEALSAGITAFVSKPLFPSDLHKVLSDCLGKTKTESEQECFGFDFTGKKLLIVEDNEINREIATELLEESGFIVDVAEDGDVAVEKMKKAEKGDYDLVLMDIQMPKMDGFEATRKIRALGTDISKIPILAMTANAFEEDRKNALEAGMNEHIAKPINIKMLKSILEKYL